MSVTSCMKVTWSLSLSFPSDLAFKSGFPRTFKPLIKTYKDVPLGSAGAAFTVPFGVVTVVTCPLICGVVGVVDGIGTGVCLTVEGDGGKGLGVTEYDCGTPFGLLIVEGGSPLGSVVGATATVRGGKDGTAREAAGEATVSIKLTEFSVALRTAASSFFFLASSCCVWVIIHFLGTVIFTGSWYHSRSLLFIILVANLRLGAPHRRFAPAFRTHHDGDTRRGKLRGDL